jgi:hypothetical protein
VAELDENGNPIPGTAAPLPPARGEQHELTDGAGQAYRRITAGIGNGLFTFYMAQRGEAWESIEPETSCVHPETDRMTYVADLPWDAAPVV